MLGERAGRRSPSGRLGSDADARVPLREEVGDFDQDDVFLFGSLDEL